MGRWPLLELEEGLAAAIGALPEVGRAEMDDAFVTTSSLMPHKRNPDLAELVRAESSPAIRRLVAHLAPLNGLPLSYQRDRQVGKPLVLEGVRRAKLGLSVLAPLVATTKFRVPVSGGDASISSVEVVDHWVRAAAPIREAHAAVDRFLQQRSGMGPQRRGIPDQELANALPELANYHSPPPRLEPKARTTRGGSSRKEVQRLLKTVAGQLGSRRRATHSERTRLDRIRQQLGVPMS